MGEKAGERREKKGEREIDSRCIMPGAWLCYLSLSAVCVLARPLVADVYRILLLSKKTLCAASISAIVVLSIYIYKVSASIEYWILNSYLRHN